MTTGVEVRYIKELESETGLTFPEAYKNGMMKQNGGVIKTTDSDWIIFPFFDKSHPARIMSTYNHIGIETINARVWDDFPKDAVAIGKNEYGDILLLSPDKEHPGMLSEVIYRWVRDTGELVRFTENIHQFLANAGCRNNSLCETHTV